MTKDINKKIFVIFVKCLLMLLLVALFGGRYILPKLQNDETSKTSIDKTIDIDWEQLYPFDTVLDEVTFGEEKDENVSIFSKVAGKLEHKSVLAEDWITSLPIYDDICNLGKAIRSKFTDTSVDGEYMKLKNGYWISKTIDTTSEMSYEDAESKMAPYISLNNYLETQGIPFYYFFPPNKECDIDDQYPDGKTYYININTKKYMQVLEDFGVEYIDLHSDLHRDGLDHYEHFFVTDHHWTAETGLWAASEIADILSEKLGRDIENVYSFGEYENVTFQDAEFGSMGMAVTHSLADSEDLVIPFPSFETKYRVEVPSKGLDITGTFDDVFVDEKEIERITSEGGGAAYGKIAYGNPPYLKITNLNNPEGPKILMIRDSFSIVVAPYLASSCSELVLLDVRPLNGNFNGSVVSCINEFEPDAVLALLSYPYNLVLNK